MADFFRRHGERPLVVFGFTYLVWSRFLVEAQRRGLRFHAPQAVLLHSGGWKKLAAGAVTKDDFNRRAAEVLGCGPAGVLDFYGMVEQVGTVFVDCPAGNKHAPAFADVLIRRSYDLRPVAPGETGIIEVVSVLPTSYPGQAILTEDQGRLLGVDDCPCGRRGSYFRFTRPHRAGGTARLRRHLRPIQGDAVNVSRFLPTSEQPVEQPLPAIIGELNAARGRLGAWRVEALLAVMDDFGRRLLRDPRTRSLEGAAFLSAWLGRTNLQKLLDLNLQGNARLSGRLRAGAATTWPPSRRGWWPCGWPATCPRCPCSRSCRPCWPRTSAW